MSRSLPKIETGTTTKNKRQERIACRKAGDAKETGKVFVELDKMPDRGRCGGDAELCPVVGLQPVNSQGAGNRQTKVFVFENSHGAPLSVALGGNSDPQTLPVFRVRRFHTLGVGIDWNQACGEDRYSPLTENH